MEKPTQLAFSDQATFTFFRLEILIPIVIIASGFIIVLVTGDASLADLALEIAIFSALCLGWVGIFVAIAWGHRLWETWAINRMFAGEIWECWQFSSSAWLARVEADCNLISPEDDGQNPYSGVIASSIFGLIIASIMIAITFFAIKDPEIKVALRISAGFVFLLLVGIGLFQPLADKYRAGRYRQKALRIAEPHVWFGPDGIYHETLGHTSLKELHKVTDQTRSRKAIQFTVVVSSDSYDDLVKVRFPVPSGSEEQAARLVLRYRQERLLT